MLLRGNLQTNLHPGESNLDSSTQIHPFHLLHRQKRTIQQEEDAFLPALVQRRCCVLGCVSKMKASSLFGFFWLFLLFGIFGAHRFEIEDGISRERPKGLDVARVWIYLDEKHNYQIDLWGIDSNCYRCLKLPLMYGISEGKPQ